MSFKTPSYTRTTSARSFLSLPLPSHAYSVNSSPRVESDRSEKVKNKATALVPNENVAKEERDLLLRIEKLMTRESDLKKKIRKKRNKERLKKTNSVCTTKNGFIIKIYPNENNIQIYRRMEQLNYYFPYYDVSESLVDGWRCIAKSAKTTKEIQLFQNEINILSKLLPSPSILRLLFSTKIEDIIYSFYEFKSRNLKKELEQKSELNQYFSIKEIAIISLEVAKGFLYLHENNVVLRDFNTSKVWVDVKDNQIVDPVIADFTVAMNLLDPNKPTNFVGTIGFIAPEIFSTRSAKKDYTKEIDVYSFGMFLYEMMTLQNPFHNVASNITEFSRIIQTETPEIPENLKFNYSPLIHLHLTCIQVNPSNRPNWVHIIDTLTNLLEDDSINILETSTSDFITRLMSGAKPLEVEEGQQLVLDESEDDLFSTHKINKSKSSSTESPSQYDHNHPILKNIKKSSNPLVSIPKQEARRPAPSRSLSSISAKLSSSSSPALTPFDESSRINSQNNSNFINQEVTYSNENTSINRNCNMESDNSINRDFTINESDYYDNTTFVNENGGDNNTILDQIVREEGFSEDLTDDGDNIDYNDDSEDVSFSDIQDKIPLENDNDSGVLYNNSQGGCEVENEINKENSTEKNYSLPIVTNNNRFNIVIGRKTVESVVVDD